MIISKEHLYQWASDLYPIPRSLTGVGVRQTLEYIRSRIPSLQIKDVKSGSKVFDWTVPDEWVVREAWVKSKRGDKIIDWSLNNLHLVGYSIPVKRLVTRDELLGHLHSVPDKPEAIPYVTSYYRPNWGFCVTHQLLSKMVEDEYEVCIDTEFKKGVMNYGEVRIPGKSHKELFITTYICHPSMGNNEVSGPVITTALIRNLIECKSLPYSIRVVFAPETIGAIAYIHGNLNDLKANVVLAMNITCVGDNNGYSFLPTKYGNTYADKLASFLIDDLNIDVKKYNWCDRGSDERQYSAPGVDLPMISLMRSKYNEYPEYHTSLDNLDYISPDGLLGGYEINRSFIDLFLKNHVPLAKTICEPHLSHYGLHSNSFTTGVSKRDNSILDFLSFADGSNDLIDIANLIELKFKQVYRLSQELEAKGLITQLSKFHIESERVGS